MQKFSILIKAKRLKITVEKDNKPKEDFFELNHYLEMTFGKDLSNLGSGLRFLRKYLHLLISNMKKVLKLIVC